MSDFYDFEARFDELAQEWKRKTINLSSIAMMESVPEYREIVELGPPAVSLILRDLKNSSAMWFSALRELTGTNPVKSGHAGNVAKMRKDWLEWGRSQNKL